MSYHRGTPRDCRTCGIAETDHANQDRRHPFLHPLSRPTYGQHRAETDYTPLGPFTDAMLSAAVDEISRRIQLSTRWLS